MQKAALLPENNTDNSVIVLNTPVFTIGRALTNSYVISDLSVSRCHSILQYTDNNWTIQNKSANKTWVNDFEVQNNTNYSLSNNDVIKLSYLVAFKFIYPYNENTSVITPSKKRKRIEAANSYQKSSINLNTKMNSGESTSAADMDNLQAELNLEKYVKNQLQEECRRLEMKLMEKDTEILDKIATTVQLEQDVLNLKANCDILEKEKIDLQLQCYDYDCENSLLKLRLDNLATLNLSTFNKSQTQNEMEDQNNLPEFTNTTEDESDMQILRTVLKAEISEKETSIKDKLMQVINLVKTVRPARATKNKPDNLQSINTKLSELQIDFEEVISKRNDLETQIKSSYQGIQNKLNVSNTEALTQSKDEFKQVLLNQEDVISDMKTVFKTDFLINFSNSLELDLQCLICHELFVKATGVDCGHIFCKKCISTWIRQQKTCPVCRKSIKITLHLISLDSYIDQCFDLLFSDKKEVREKLKKSHADEASTSTAAHNQRSYPIEINNYDINSDIEISSRSSDNEPETDYEPYPSIEISSSSSDFETETDYEYDISYEPRRRYGSCFVCGDRGHWANECPSRRPRRR